MSLSFNHAVLEWARTKPADEAYEYENPQSCAIGLFLIETGRAKRPQVVGNAWRDDHDNWHDFDYALDKAAYRGEETFGAFADRLEKALAA